jgi:hypothetical protein
MQEFTVSLNEQEINTVLAGLGELPFKLSWQVFNKIQVQIAQKKAAPVNLSDLGFTEVSKTERDAA